MNSIELFFEEIAKISIFMQIPIVVLLILFSYQIYSVIKIEKFKLIFWGLIFNFLYLLNIIIIYYFKIPSHDNIPKIIGADLFTTIESIYFQHVNIFCFTSNVLDFIYCYLFLIASVDVRKIFKTNKRLLIANILLFLSFSFFIIIKYFIWDKDELSYVFRISLPIVLFDIISFYFLSKYFKSITKTFHKSKSLYYGCLVYFFIQFLGFMDNYNHNGFFVIGFIVSLIAKVLILYGFHRLFISNAEKINLLKNTLGSTFHDVNRLLIRVEEIISEIIKRRTNSELTKELEITFSQAFATFTAQKTLYEIAISKNANFNINEYNLKELDTVFDKSKEENVNINTLLQISINTLRKDLNKEIRIITEYSSNCSVLCVKYELVRVFTNIIKNSIDSIAIDGGVIYIKTYKNEINLKDETIKEVIIEISDSGNGIKTDFLKKIFEAGFTTKHGDDRGYGLNIVKKIIENKYNGKIEVFSPYKHKRLNTEKNGIMFKITLNTL